MTKEKLSLRQEGIYVELKIGERAKVQLAPVDYDILRDWFLQAQLCSARPIELSVVSP